MDKKALRRKIEKELEKSKEILPFYKYGSNVFFYSASGYLVSLNSEVFAKKLSFLRGCFKGRGQIDKDRLIRENLSIFAIPFNDKEELIPKIELVYDSCFVQCWKISNYGEDLDYKNVNPRTLTSLRGEELGNNINEWNTAYERTSWITEYALKVRDWLRKTLVGD